MNVNSVNDIALLLVNGENDWSKYGNVKTVTNGDLTLFSYTNEAQYANLWNEFEQLCRGLIINNQTGEIVARPFKKFFNWSQRYGVGQEKVAFPNRNTHLVNVFEKLDGSLGILYRQNGQHKIATRGSFESDQAIWATEFLNDTFDLSDLPNGITLLFEILYPENRIVVDYGDREDLILLAVIGNKSGKEYPFYPTVYDIAEYYKFNLPKVYSFNNPTEILESAANLTGTSQEGYVLLYSDGSRFKIKGDDYLYIHKIISNISKKNVFNMWANSMEFPDIPDEFINQLELWYEEFDTVAQEIEDESRWMYQNAPKTSRRDFALAVKDHMFSSVIFAMYDNDNGKVTKTINSLVEKICLSGESDG